MKQMFLAVAFLISFNLRAGIMYIDDTIPPTDDEDKKPPVTDVPPIQRP